MTLFFLLCLMKTLNATSFSQMFMSHSSASLSINGCFLTCCICHVDGWNDLVFSYISCKCSMRPRFLACLCLTRLRDCQSVAPQFISRIAGLSLHGNQVLRPQPLLHFSFSIFLIWLFFSSSSPSLSASSSASASASASTSTSFSFPFSFPF